MNVCVIYFVLFCFILFYVVLFYFLFLLFDPTRGGCMCVSESVSVYVCV